MTGLQGKALTREQLNAQVTPLVLVPAQPSQPGWYFACCGRWQPNRDHKCTAGMVGSR